MKSILFEKICIVLSQPRARNILQPLLQKFITENIGGYVLFYDILQDPLFITIKQQVDILLNETINFTKKNDTHRIWYLLDQTDALDFKNRSIEKIFNYNKLYLTINCSPVSHWYFLNVLDYIYIHFNDKFNDLFAYYTGAMIKYVKSEYRVKFSADLLNESTMKEYLIFFHYFARAKKYNQINDQTKQFLNFLTEDDFKYFAKNEKLSIEINSIDFIKLVHDNPFFVLNGEHYFEKIVFLNISNPKEVENSLTMNDFLSFIEQNNKIFYQLFIDNMNKNITLSKFKEIKLAIL
jgi:hypothetical protein